MNVIKMDKITRQFVQDNPQYLFLFGDNLTGKGMGGQAKEMRGEPNTQGVPTKHKPTMDRDAFFVDEEYAQIKFLYDQLFMMIHAVYRAGKFEAVVIPMAGLGTGLAELPTRAPRIYQYLQDKLKEMEAL